MLVQFYRRENNKTREFKFKSTLNKHKRTTHMHKNKQDINRQ